MRLDVFESIRSRRRGDESDWFEQSFIANLGGVIRSVDALNAREGLMPIDGASPARDWDALIAQVRNAAHGPREAEASLRRREVQAQNLLRSAHRRIDEAAARMTEAEEKMREADERVRAVEARAAVRIEAAERRASRAEEAARSALDWLQRVRQAEAARPLAHPSIEAPRRLLRRVA